VFEQQEGVTDAALFHGVADLFLKLQAVGVGEAAEVDDRQLVA
jgi:hypothetical protein